MWPLFSHTLGSEERLILASFGPAWGETSWQARSATLFLLEAG